MATRTLDAEVERRPRDRASGFSRRVRPGAADGLTVAVLCGLVVAGLLLRLQGVFRFVLEQDELYTVREATELWATDLKPGISARPLYFLFQHILLDWFPATPVAIRLPALFFGALGIWLTWRSATRFGRLAGWTAAALLALSPWHLYVSGMARYWAALYALSAGFLLVLTNAVESGERRYYFGALVILVAGAATHPTFLFTACGVALGVHMVSQSGALRFPWPDRRALQWLWLPFALVLSTAAAALVMTGNEEAVQNWGGRGILSTLRLVPAMIEWAGPTLVAAAGMGAIVLIRNGDASGIRWGWMTLLGSLSAIVLLIAASMRTDVYADYAVSALPLLPVCAGALVQRLASLGAAMTRRWLPLGAVLLVITGLLPSVVSHAIGGTRFDYRPAYEQLERTASRATVFTWPLNIARHYAPSLNSVPLTSATRMQHRLDEEGELWVVLSLRRYGIAGGDGGGVRAWVDGTCRIKGRYEHPRIDDRVYRVELYHCLADNAAPQVGSVAPQIEGS